MSLTQDTDGGGPRDPRPGDPKPSLPDFSPSHPLESDPFDNDLKWEGGAVVSSRNYTAPRSFQDDGDGYVLTQIFRVITGTKKSDFSLQGGNGDDFIFAGNGNDYVNARNGNDLINGGKGNDRITGGKGNDTMFGGEGADVFLFRKQGYAADTDTIMDYRPGDLVELSGFGDAPKIKEVPSTYGYENFRVGNQTIQVKGTGDADIKVVSLEDNLYRFEWDYN